MALRFYTISVNGGVLFFVLGFFSFFVFVLVVFFVFVSLTYSNLILNNSRNCSGNGSLRQSLVREIHESQWHARS